MFRLRIAIISHNQWKCNSPASLQLADLSFINQPIQIDDKFDRLMDVLKNLTICASNHNYLGTVRVGCSRSSAYSKFWSPSVLFVRPLPVFINDLLEVVSVKMLSTVW